MTLQGSPSRRAWWITTLAGVLLSAVGLVALAVGLSRQYPTPPAPPGEHERAASAVSSRATPHRSTPPPSPSPSTAALDWARPVRVVIPSLDVSATLESLDADATGAMQVPRDPAQAGWFTPAPPPGMPGVSVIAGHVTWDRVPAVFFRLGDLRAGDKVLVERADRVTAVFKVDRIGQFAKDSFPTEQVYRQVDDAELRLITCGGRYDEATHSYLSNVIVWARMVSYHRG